MDSGDIGVPPHEVRLRRRNDWIEVADLFFVFLVITLETIEVGTFFLVVSLKMDTNSFLSTFCIEFEVSISLFVDKHWFYAQYSIQSVK